MSVTLTPMWHTPGLLTRYNPAVTSPPTTTLALDPTGGVWTGRIDGSITGPNNTQLHCPANEPITAMGCVHNTLAVGTHGGAVYTTPIDTHGTPAGPLELVHRHQGPVTSAFWADAALVTAGWDGQILLRRAGATEPLRAGGAAVNATTRTPNGFAAAFADGTVHTYRHDARTPTTLLPLDIPATALAATRNQLVLATADHKVATVHAGGGLRWSRARPASMPTGAAIDAHHHIAAITSADGLLRLWSLADLTPRRIISTALAPLAPALLSPHHNLHYALRGGGVSSVRVHAGLADDRVHDGHHGPPWAVKISGSARMVATAGADSTVRLLAAATGYHLRTLYGHDGWVNAVAFTADGRTLATGSADSTVRLWNPHTGQPLRTLYGHDGWVNAVAFTADGRTLATGSADSTIRLWDTATGATLRVLRGHRGWINTLSLADDGTLLASGAGDATVMVWDPRTGQHLRTLTGHDKPVTSVHAGRTVIMSTGYDTRVIAWALDGQPTVLGHHDRHAWMVTADLDDHVAVSVGADRSAIVWDLRDRTQAKHRLTDVGTACHIAPVDGHTRLALISRDGTLDMLAVDRRDSHRTHEW